MRTPQSVLLGTADVARATQYSTQQVRDLERLGVIPPAQRSGNGYRRYTTAHVAAARAYRGLAAAIGPTDSRRLLRTLLSSSVDDAAAAIDGAHAGLAAEREQVRLALRVIREPASETTRQDDAPMSITQLAEAIGVRSSTLRHWDAEGLVVPHRVTSLQARQYSAAAVREARVVVALRASGHGIDSVRDILTRLRTLGNSADAERILDDRLRQITRRSVALLRAGAQLAEVLDDLFAV